jgi:hypothetical protein
MTDQLLDILKIAFLVLLYLFFARVVWVVLNEVRATRSGANTSGANVPQNVSQGGPVNAPVSVGPAAATHLGPDPTLAAGPPGAGAAAGAGAGAVAATRRSEPKARKGKRGGIGRLVVIEPRARRGSTYAVGGELTLGRSAGCTVTIPDDTFVSNVHARVFVADGYTIVEDLGSTNGTYLNGVRLTDARPVRKGDRVQVGQTVLEAQ